MCFFAEIMLTLTLEIVEELKRENAVRDRATSSLDLEWLLDVTLPIRVCHRSSVVTSSFQFIHSESESEAHLSPSTYCSAGTVGTTPK